MRRTLLAEGSDALTAIGTSSLSTRSCSLITAMASGALAAIRRARSSVKASISPAGTSQLMMPHSSACAAPAGAAVKNSSLMTLSRSLPMKCSKPVVL